MANGFEKTTLDNISQQRLQKIERLGGIPGLMNALRVDEKQGLDSNDTKDIQERKKTFGVNQFHSYQSSSFWIHLM